jgi:hypothetical protein
VWLGVTFLTSYSHSDFHLSKLAFSKLLRPLSFSPRSPLSYVRACHRPIFAEKAPTNVNTYIKHPQRSNGLYRTMATLSAQRKHKVTIVGSGNWCVASYINPFLLYWRKERQDYTTGS